MNVTLLSEANWKPSELKRLEEALGPIVPPNTYEAILVDRTPGGWRWYAWVRTGEWLVVAEGLEEMVEGVLERMNGKGGGKCQKQGN